MHIISHKAWLKEISSYICDTHALEPYIKSIFYYWIEVFAKHHLLEAEGMDGVIGFTYLLFKHI